MECWGCEGEATFRARAVDAETDADQGCGRSTSAATPHRNHSGRTFLTSAKKQSRILLTIPQIPRIICGCIPPVVFPNAVNS